MGRRIGDTRTMRWKVHTLRQASGSWLAVCAGENLRTNIDRLIDRITESRGCVTTPANNSDTSELQSVT